MHNQQHLWMLYAYVSCWRNNFDLCSVVLSTLEADIRLRANAMSFPSFIVSFTFRTDKHDRVYLIHTCVFVWPRTWAVWFLVWLCSSGPTKLHRRMELLTYFFQRFPMHVCWAHVCLGRLFAVTCWVKSYPFVSAHTKHYIADNHRKVGKSNCCSDAIAQNTVEHVKPIYGAGVCLLTRREWNLFELPAWTKANETNANFTPGC